MNKRNLWKIPVLLLCLSLVNACSSKDTSEPTTSNATTEAVATSTTNSDQVEPTAVTNSETTTTDLAEVKDNLLGDDTTAGTSDEPASNNDLAMQNDQSGTLSGDVIADERQRDPESWTKKGSWETGDPVAEQGNDPAATNPDSDLMARNQEDPAETIDANAQAHELPTAEGEEDAAPKEISAANPGDTLVAAERKEDIKTETQEESFGQAEGNRGYISGTAKIDDEASDDSQSEQKVATAKKAASDKETNSSKKSSPRKSRKNDESAKPGKKDPEARAKTNTAANENSGSDGKASSFNGKILSLNVAANSIMVKDPETSIAKIFKAKDKSLLNSIKEGDLVSVIYNPGDTTTAEDIIVR